MTIGQMRDKEEVHKGTPTKQSDQDESVVLPLNLHCPQCGCYFSMEVAINCPKGPSRQLAANDDEELKHIPDAELEKAREDMPRTKSREDMPSTSTSDMVSPPPPVPSTSTTSNLVSVLPFVFWGTLVFVGATTAAAMYYGVTRGDEIVSQIKKAREGWTAAGSPIIIYPKIIWSGKK